MRAVFWMVLATSIFMTSPAHCESDDGPKIPLAISDVTFKEGKLWLEFENFGEADLLLLNKLDPEFGVVTVNAMTPKNETIKVSTKHKDWIAAPEDRLRLRGKTRITRAIAVDLAPGRYTVSVTYEVKKDSFFMDAWFIKKGETRETESKKVMSDFFFGSVSSKDFEIVIPGEAKPAEK